MPIVGFDTQNYRLGMGGGWFDRLLARQPAALNIGLAYDMSRVSTIYPEIHDIPVDIVVTETQLYRRSI